MRNGPKVLVDLLAKCDRTQEKDSWGPVMWSTRLRRPLPGINVG
jgi:hypothetical protein